MKYLVTGGAGFIGSTLSNRLLNEGNEVFVIDDLSMGKESNLIKSAQLTFIEGSVNDKYLMEEILFDHKFDYIFHLAAIASVADSIERPIETHEVNYDSTLLLIELIKKYQKNNLKRLVFSSSAAVYGDGPEKIKKEDSSIHPKSQYAVDKYASEKTVLNAYELYNVNSTAVRFFNVYGPNQNPKSPYSGVISIVFDKLKSILENKESIFVLYGDGQQVRDFIYVEDVVDALILVSNSISSLGKVYNVATSVECSINNMIKIVEEETRMKINRIQEQNRKGDIKFSLANTDELRNLGFTPKYHIRDGLRILINNMYNGGVQ